MFTPAGSDPTRRFGAHIAVAATRACPLTCAHCITRSDPTSPAAATGFAAALGVFLGEQLFGSGLVSITGGEPFYDLPATDAVIRQAKQSGRAVNIVTSAFWAKSPAAAQEMLGRLPSFDSLTLSCDPHHARFVPSRHIENAYRAAKLANMAVRVRLVQAAPPTGDELALERVVREYARDDEIELQLLLAYGRAADLELQGADFASLEREHCPSTGPYVDADGSVLPCCSTILSIQSDNPLSMGNVISDSPSTISASFLNSVLFAALKIRGAAAFRELLRPRLNGQVDSMSICDLCYAVCSSPAIHDEVLGHLSREEAKLEMYARGALQLGMSELTPLVEDAAKALLSAR